MRPLARLIVLLLCMFANKVTAETFGERVHIVDYRTLKTCYSNRVSNLAPALTIPNPVGLTAVGFHFEFLGLSWVASVC